MATWMQLNKLAPDANLIQIDGGWWTERGDYQSVRPDLLPGGIKAIAARIASEGKIPGLHFDGFRGDANSEIYKTHPEYFLHDQDGKLIVEVNEKPDKVMKNIYFDYSHPGARAYIAECIRNMKENWGIRYFKVDFMRYGLEDDIKAANKQVKTIKAHDPTITSVERFRLGMKTMREAMGPDTYFLGCSAVFGPCIGFVDGMRTGGDINPRYEAFPERSLANLGHFYLSGKVFNGDADYLVFRAAADEDEKVSKENVKHGGSLTMNEAQMWADLNKLYGNFRLHSDNLMTLRPERQALVKEVFQYPAMDETVPLDVWRHATSKGRRLRVGARPEGQGDLSRRLQLGRHAEGLRAGGVRKVRARQTGRPPFRDAEIRRERFVCSTLSETSITMKSRIVINRVRRMKLYRRGFLGCDGCRAGLGWLGTGSRPGRDESARGLAGHHR